MAFHESAILDSEPQRTLGAIGPRLFKLGAAAALIGLAAAGALAMFGGDHALERVLYAYVTNFAYVVSIAFGALLFVMVHFVAKTGTITTYRRIGELFAATLPMLGVLALPVLFGMEQIYHAWVHPAAGDEIVAAKLSFLNPVFFGARMVGYFLVLGLLALSFLRCSSKQDETADPAITLKLQGRATWGILLFAVGVTFFAVDLIKSLDPHWFSTIFGVYYFAGGFMAFHSLMALTVIRFQKRGLLTNSINKEHFHDIGKMMFAFVVFWTYIAFSQYMLIWYGNIPEETVWYIRRGATTDPAHANGWSYVSIALLVGHFFIPFLGMVSRYIKRDTSKLAFWAVWLLAIHYLDMIWLVRPELKDHTTHATIAVNWVDIASLAACLLVVGGVAVATFAKLAEKRNLVAINDPRLPEGLAFENI